MKGQETEQKITIKTAAQILGVSPKTIQRYLAKGRLTKVKGRDKDTSPAGRSESAGDDPSLGQGRPTAGVSKGMGRDRSETP